MVECYQRVLSQHREDDLLNFLTTICRIDPTRRCLRSNLHQRYNGHRTWNGSYPELLVGRDEFTTMMKPMCVRLGLIYKRFKEGWCYVGITTGDDNLVLRTSSTKEERDIRDRNYRQSHRDEFNARQQTMRAIDKTLDDLGLSMQNIKILRSQNLFRLIYRQDRTRIRWSDRSTDDNIRTHIDIPETLRCNLEQVHILQEDHMVPKEVSADIQHRLLAQVIRSSFERKPEPKPRLRIIHDRPVDIALPSWLIETPVITSIRPNASYDEVNDITESSSPNKIRLRMQEISDRCDLLAPGTREYETLENEYIRYEALLATKQN